MIFDPNPENFPSHAAVAWGEDAYGLWQAFELNGVRQTMRWIIPGTFNMGSPKHEKNRRENETLHKVTLSQGYWLAETTCTQALWLAVMGKNPSKFDSDDQNPVERVSWDDCQTFIARCNKLLKGAITLSLPTEAQWEYACRAGTNTVFNWGNDLSSQQANFDGNFPYGDAKKDEYREKTLTVHNFKPNNWGLYQMHGNVWEWCEDLRGDYGSEDVIDPIGLEGHRRVLRGGSWILNGRYVRSADRLAYSPDNRNDYVGLRLAGGLDPQASKSLHALSADGLERSES